jgi:hypothetical protein
MQVSAVAAQVIPVLYLVLGIELRVFARDKTPESVYRGLAVFVFVALAEMIALSNLAFATTVPEWTKWWMLAAIPLQLTMIGHLVLRARDD